jgi:ABC-2 type transport system permease protein
VFGFPLLMAMGLGVAFRNKPPQKPAVALVSSQQASPFTQALLQSPGLDAKSVSKEEAMRGLARARFDLVVRLHPGTPPRLDYDPMQERSTLARAVVANVLERSAGRQDQLNISENAITAPGSRYIDFLLPGLIGLNVMGSSMWGVGYNLVVARKRRLLRRYAVTPMSRLHFLLSYFFSRAVFLVMELGVLLVFGALIFDTRLAGSLLSFLLMATSGAAAFAAISLLIGARVSNTEVANGWMNFVQLPMWVFSGAFFSYERFPEWLQLPIQFLPLTALVDGLRAIFNDGTSILALGFPLAVLGAWCIAGFFVATRGFRWQ